MKTPYNEIVNIASIGSQTNPIFIMANMLVVRYVIITQMFLLSQYHKG